jgi:hypothetical protein
MPKETLRNMVQMEDRCQKKELYLEASMPKPIEEIINATEKEAKIYTTIGTPGKCLTKNEGEPVMLDEYRSLVGKIMYYATNWHQS